MEASLVMDQIHKRGMGDEQLNTVISIPRSCHLDRKSGAKSCTQAIGWGHLQEEFPGRITEDCHSHQDSGSLGTMWTVWVIYRAELPAEMLRLINYLCCKCKFRKDPWTCKSINTWASGTIIMTRERNPILSYMHSMASTVWITRWNHMKLPFRRSTMVELWQLPLFQLNMTHRKKTRNNCNKILMVTLSIAFTSRETRYRGYLLQIGRMSSLWYLYFFMSL